MRPLIIALLALIVSDAEASEAANATSNVSVAEPSFKVQKLDVNYRKISFSVHSQTLEVDEVGVSEQTALTSQFKVKKTNIDFSFSKNKNDYSKTLIRNKDGSEERLSQIFDKDEYASAVGVSTYFGSHDLSISAASSISDSPYSQAGQKIQYSYRGPNDSYKLGGSVETKTTEQPDNYFINRELQTQKSPEKLVTQQLQLTYEQVFTDNFKAQVVFLNGVRRADRPDNKGYILKTGYAINEFLFLKNQLGAIAEENTSLKNNRGRYAVRFFDAELGLNFSYRLQFTFGYGLSVETEKQSYAAADTQVGHDIYSSGLRYRINNYTLLSDVSLRESNIDTKEYNFSGGLSWDI